MLEIAAKYWLEWIFGIVAAVLAGLYRNLSKKIEKQKEENKAIKNGLQAVLHDRLYQTCKYYIGLGYVDTDGLENASIVYKSYHALGGNGTGTLLYEKLKALPLKED